VFILPSLKAGVKKLRYHYMLAGFPASLAGFSGFLAGFSGLLAGLSCRVALPCTRAWVNTLQEATDRRTFLSIHPSGTDAASATVLPQTKLYRWP